MKIFTFFNISARYVKKTLTNLTSAIVGASVPVERIMNKRLNHLSCEPFEFGVLEFLFLYSDRQPKYVSQNQR